MYKIDMHVHTSETSSCGKVPAAELAALYADAGYNGIVITDHFYNDYFERLQGLEWNDKIDIYMSGYKTALATGKSLGLDVFLGMEIRFKENANDYLVFGITKDFLLENKDLCDLGLKKFKSLIQDKNILIYQAHPFRPGLIAAPPQLLDGVEIYNGNPRHDSKNYLAYEMAKTNNLKMISGSDFHQLQDLARGGLILNERPHNERELFNILRNNSIAEFLQL